MATGVLLTPPIISFAGGNGLPAVNGSLLFQVGGANAAVYQDAALTTPLPNPVPLNSRGEISTSNGVSSQCFLTPNTVYTVTLFDSTGLQQWSASYVNGVQISASTVGAVIFPRSTQEINAGIIPSSLAYPVSPYHDIRRYGFVGDGVTDDSAAWSALASVMGQGASGFVPPGNTMVKSQVTIVAPNYQRIVLTAYGVSLYTTGSIYGLKVTGGFMGGIDIMGLTHVNTTDSLALGGITFFGAQNCYAIDCWANLSGSQASSAGYALVTLQPADPTNDNTGPFWNKVIRCGTRQPIGNVSFYAPFGVLLLGAANSTEITGCNFTSVNQAVGIYNQIGGSNTGTLANGVFVHHNAFEGGVSAVLVNGQSSVAAGATITGLRIESNRAESLTGQFVLFQAITADSAVPSLLTNNWLSSSVVNYITYSNAAITVNSDDAAFTSSYPIALTFTGALSNGATSGTISSVLGVSNWPRATGQWQVQFSDGETIQCTFTNGSNSVVFASGITAGGGVTANATVVTGEMTRLSTQGPFNRTSIAGDVDILTAPSEYGSVIGTSTIHNIRARNRSGGGGYHQYPNGGDLRGIDGLSRTATVRRRRLSGVATFVASTTVTVNLNPAEPDSNYMILIEPNAIAGAMTPGTKATGSFVITAANSNSQTINWMLIGL